ncbi:MAG: hypothetical protein ACI9KE_000811 [Polyangiales bacterium]|jgi:hypothetical protein
MHAISPIAALLLLLSAGCDGSTPASDSGPFDSEVPVTDAAPEDAGMDAGPDIVIDGGTSDVGPVCGDPGSPYGTSLGSSFLPFTMPTCGDVPFEFYGETEGFCDATFTVVSLAAGWCGPCRLEASLMQEYLVDGYAEHGVRVVVAVIQDNNLAEPTSEFCNRWVEQYELTNPVVYDTEGVTQIYFPDGSLPATLIVDSQGVIVHREYGVSDELVTVRATLDRLLGL